MSLLMNNHEHKFLSHAKLEGGGVQSLHLGRRIVAHCTYLEPLLLLSKGAITSKMKHAIKLKTSPANLHNCCTAVAVLDGMPLLAAS